MAVQSFAPEVLNLVDQFHKAYKKVHGVEFSGVVNLRKIRGDAYYGNVRFEVLDDNKTQNYDQYEFECMIRVLDNILDTLKTTDSQHLLEARILHGCLNEKIACIQNPCLSPKVALYLLTDENKEVRRLASTEKNISLAISFIKTTMDDRIRSIFWSWSGTNKEICKRSFDDLLKDECFRRVYKSNNRKLLKTVNAIKQRIINEKNQIENGILETIKKAENHGAKWENSLNRFKKIIGAEDYDLFNTQLTNDISSTSVLYDNYKEYQKNKGEGDGFIDYYFKRFNIHYKYWLDDNKKIIEQLDNWINNKPCFPNCYPTTQWNTTLDSWQRLIHHIEDRLIRFENERHEQKIKVNLIHTINEESSRSDFTKYCLSLKSIPNSLRNKEFFKEFQRMAYQVIENRRIGLPEGDWFYEFKEKIYQIGAFYGFSASENKGIITAVVNYAKGEHQFTIWPRQDQVFSCLWEELVYTNILGAIKDMLTVEVRAGGYLKDYGIVKDKIVVNKQRVKVKRFPRIKSIYKKRVGTKTKHNKGEPYPVSWFTRSLPKSPTAGPKARLKAAKTSGIAYEMWDTAYKGLTYMPPHWRNVPLDKKEEYKNKTVINRLSQSFNLSLEIVLKDFLDSFN